LRSMSFRGRIAADMCRSELIVCEHMRISVPGESILGEKLLESGKSNALAILERVVKGGNGVTVFHS